MELIKPEMLQRLATCFFANDSLLFGAATEAMEDGNQVHQLLRDYERASGQKINYEKSSLFFGAFVGNEIRTRLKDVLGVPIVQCHEKYLGLPTLMGREKKRVFKEERVWKKLQGWKEKLLSKAGKEILIKAVAQAIPTYTMSCFKISVSLAHELEMMIARFWWGNGGDKKGIHWVAWDKLCKSKFEGGLGFKSLQAFNTTMLAKQGWRLIQCPDSLFTKVFKVKYFPNYSFQEAKEGLKPSFAWNSILHGR